MKVVRSVAELRAMRSSWPKLGLVPTMGFLHAGHLSLVQRARAECGAAAVSIFVNPTQFAPTEDLGRYPRDLPGDLAQLERAGVALAFVPGPDDMYPAGFSSRIEVGPLGERLEGAARPGHFSGVATVVLKLIGIVQPTRIYFGQKDAQQCAVIRRMVRDLDQDVAVVVGETVRDADGLALSSRNSYLTPEQRSQAPVLYRALCAARALYDAGEREAEPLRQAVRDVLASEPGVTIDYVSVAEPALLQERVRIDGPVVVSLAARIGGTRLIDNVVLPSPPVTLSRAAAESAAPRARRRAS